MVSFLHMATSRKYTKKWQLMAKAHIDKYPKCASCGYTERHRLVAHHLIYRDSTLPYGSFEKPGDLRTLCLKCHGRLHGIFGHDMYSKEMRQAQLQWIKCNPDARNGRWQTAKERKAMVARKERARKKRKNRQREQEIQNKKMAKNMASFLEGRAEEKKAEMRAKALTRVSRQNLQKSAKPSLARPGGI